VPGGLEQGERHAAVHAAIQGPAEETLNTSWGSIRSAHGLLHEGQGESLVLPYYTRKRPSISLYLSSI